MLDTKVLKAARHHSSYHNLNVLVGAAIDVSTTIGVSDHIQLDTTMNEDQILSSPPTKTKTTSSSTTTATNMSTQIFDNQFPGCNTDAIYNEDIHFQHMYSFLSIIPHGPTTSVPDRKLIDIDTWFDSEEEFILDVIKTKVNNGPLTNAEKQKRSRLKKEQLMHLKNDKYFKMNKLCKLGDSFLDYPQYGSLGVAMAWFDEIRKICADGILNEQKKQTCGKPIFIITSTKCHLVFSAHLIMCNMNILVWSHSN